MDTVTRLPEPEPKIDLPTTVGAICLLILLAIGVVPALGPWLAADAADHRAVQQAVGQAVIGAAAPSGWPVAVYDPVTKTLTVTRHFPRDGLIRVDDAVFTAGELIGIYQAGGGK